MVRYVVLLNYLEKGVASLKESPNRASHFMQAAEKVGAKVESLVWTQGDVDGLFHLSAPDEATAAALVLNLAQSGNVRTTMLRAFDANEFGAIVSKMG